MLFTWTRWLAKNKSQARKPYRRPASFRPQIEPLETRLAPASLTVTNLNDNTNWTSGDGSLRGEIAAAASGDTIVFQSGLTGTITLNSTNGTLALSENLTIAGPGASTIAISGGGSVQIFSVAAGATANISGLELDDGQDSAAGGGGAIDNLGTLYVNNCNFSNNAASKGGNSTHAGGGGAIDNNGYLAINGSTFQNNTATNSSFYVTGNGGAIYNTGTLVVCGSAFTSNHSINSDGASGSYGSGGAIFTTGTLTLNGCNFTGNISDHEGGAVRAILSTNFTVDNSTFTGNQANQNSGGGGAIMVADASLSSAINVDIVGSTFSNNSTNGSGGAIVAFGDINLAVILSSFTQNTASSSTVGHGGAIAQEADLASPTVAITDCTFSQNVATTSGGGIYEWGNGNSDQIRGTITGCTFTGNTATDSGGGAYVAYDSLTFANDTFAANSGLFGGGIYSYQGTTNVNNCTIASNFATYFNASSTGAGAGVQGVSLYDSIVDANTVAGEEMDAKLSSSSGYNLIGTLPSNLKPYMGFTLASSDIIDPNNNPHLGSLASNGGPTGTMLPQAGSPAINTGDPSFISPPFTDQRGYTRVAGGRIDIGAVESGASADAVVKLSAGAVPEATPNTSYAGYTFAATGGTTPYVYGITAGSLPPGMTLQGGGLLTGTPLASGAFSFTVTAVDNFGNIATQNYTILSGVLPTVSLSESGSPFGENGGAASITVTLNGASNQDATIPLTFTGTASGSDYSPSLTSITIPAGSLSGSIRLTGASNAGFGTASQTVIVGLGTLTNGTPGSPASVTLTINPAIVVSPIGLAIGSLDNSYSQTITATGGAGSPYTFTTTGPLDGLKLSTAGILSGTPTNTGTFNFTVTATDGSGATGSQQYTLTINPTLALTVNTTDDTAAVNPANSPVDSSGNISLRSAIQFADANHYLATIDFAADLGSLITLTSALPQITSNLTIQGPGAGALSVSGNDLYQVFLPNATVAISGLTIEDGYGSFGGGISAGGNLTLTDDTIINCASTAFGGGIFINGGVLTLTDDTFDNDTSSAWGGAIFTNGGMQTLTNVTITNCKAGAGGAIAINGSTFTLIDDTLANNTATQGGAISRGGSSPLNLTNVTLWNNSASSSGGGIYGGATSLINVTLTGNSAGKTAGGIYGGAGDVYNSIIAGNSATYNPDAQGTFTSQGNNLIGYVGSSIGWVSSDLLNIADPGLGTLQNNGGPTQTIALLPGSPALGAGNTAGAPDTDQRGAQRVVNGAIDIGAFENQTQLFTLTPPASNPNPDIGIAASFNLGSFTESGSTGNPWTVTVNWGDGTPDSVFSANRQGTLPNQPHIYTTNTNSPYTVTVTVTDANSNFAQMTFQVTVNPPIVVSPTSATGLAIGTVGNSYSQTITASGGAGGTYTFTTTDPLDGLVLSTDGSLSGSPSTSGSFTFTVIATDSNGGTGSQEYTLTVNPALAITTTALPADTAGIGYSQQIAATGGSGSFTFIVSAGNLPAGLKLSSNGLLSGTPTSTNGSPFSFTIQVTDSNSITATQNYSLTINAGAAASIAVSVGSPQSTLANAAFAANLTAIVKDKYGNPVPNVTVLFAAPTTGPSGTFSGSVSVLTNSNGIAPAPTFTANLFAGTYTVTASTSGVNTPANFSLTNRSSLGSSANAIYVHNVYALLLSRLPDPGAQGWVAALNGGMAPATLVQDLEGSTEYLNDVVKGLYLHYLKRPADSGGLNAWTSALASGATIEQVIDGLVSSPEYSALHGNSNSGFVSGLYTDILNRTPSAGEVQSWVNVLNGGTTRAQAAMDFLSSTEYRIDLVDSYYLEYLRRPADSGGQSAWVNQLASGVSDQAVLAALLGSAEGYAKWS